MNPSHPLNFMPWIPKNEQWLVEKHWKRSEIKTVSSDQVNFLSAIQAKLKAWQMDYYDFADPDTILAMLIHNIYTRKQLIIRKMIRARQRSDFIKNQLLRIEKPGEKDRFLMNSFLVESVCGYRKVKKDKWDYIR